MYSHEVVAEVRCSDSSDGSEGEDNILLLVVVVVVGSHPQPTEGNDPTQSYDENGHHAARMRSWCHTWNTASRICLEKR